MINMKGNQLWDDWRYWPPRDKQIYSFTSFSNKNLVLTNQSTLGPGLRQRRKILQNLGGFKEWSSATCTNVEDVHNILLFQKKLAQEIGLTCYFWCIRWIGRW